MIEASQGGRLEIIQAILKTAENLNIRKGVLNAQDDIGISGLHWTILRKHPKASHLLLENGCDVNTSMNVVGQTPLMVASSMGLLDVVEALIEKGAVIDARRQDGGHAAYDAAEEGHVAILKLLVKNNPSVANLAGLQDKTPLSTAAMHRRSEVMKYLESKVYEK